MKKVYKLLATLLAVSVCLMMPISVSADNLTCETYDFVYEYSVDADGNATILGAQANTWVVGRPLTIPEILDEHTVVAIADNVFEAYTGGFRILTIPTSLVSIGNNVFHNCPLLLQVHYLGTEQQWAALLENSGEQNEDLLQISPFFLENDFEYCVYDEYAEIMWYRGSVNTTELNLPATLGGREVRAVSSDPMSMGFLADHRNIEKVTFPDTLLRIYDKSFAGLPLKEVVLPENLEEINKGCFKNCYDLTTVTIPDSPYHIPYLFENCGALEDIYFEGTQTEWNAYEIAEYIPLYHPEAVVHFGEASGQCGDYDDNGDINMNDALKLYQGAAGNVALDAIFSAMDVNGDGIVNMMDALMLYDMVS